MKYRVFPIVLRLVFGLAVVVGFYGCGRDGRQEKIIDLVEVFPEARVSVETNSLNLTERSARQMLGAGWWIGQNADKTKSAAWGYGGRSEMAFFRLKPRELTFHFWCRPYDFKEGRGQAVSFIVNGSLIQKVDLDSGPQSVKVTVPAEVLRSGENYLVMEYAASQNQGVPFVSPREDRAVLWSSVVITPRAVIGGDSPKADVSSDELFIPWGSRVDFSLGSLGDAKLIVSGSRVVGNESGRLVGSFQIGDRPEEFIEGIDQWQGPASAEIPGAEQSEIRLSLAAVGDGHSKPEEESGVVVMAPRVVSHVVASTPSTSIEMEEGDESKELKRPNIVIYLIDALRADHLGCYGYDRPTSRRIDEFAEHAVVFERAQAQTSWTRASVASIFTGLMPQVHGANDDDDALSESLMTLAEYLRAGGYQTAGFLANGNAGPNVGFGQGFDIFRNLGPVRSEDLNQEVSRWLDEKEDQRPFFLWVHAVDPHAPYMPPEDLRARFCPDVVDRDMGSITRVLKLGRHSGQISSKVIEDMVALYDAEIASNDRSFGALLDDLETRGLRDDALIIVVADHGEEFYDHGGWTHGKTLFAEVLDIPLIIKYPLTNEGARISQIVRHIDVLPTVLEVAGLGIPDEGIQGASLQVLMSLEGREKWVNQSMSSLEFRGRKGTSVLNGRWKVIRMEDRYTGFFPMLFDKESDRREVHDLALEKPGMLATMMASQHRLVTRLPDAVDAPVVDTSAKIEMREALEALGYIE